MAGTIHAGRVCEERCCTSFFLSQALENEGKLGYKGGHLGWGALLGIQSNVPSMCCAQVWTSTFHTHLFQIPDELWK